MSMNTLHKQTNKNHIYNSTNTIVRDLKNQTKPCQKKFILEKLPKCQEQQESMILFPGAPCIHPLQLSPNLVSKMSLPVWS